MTDEGTTDLTTRLTSAERERHWTNVRPSDAATLIVIDRSKTKPRVLMGKRHPDHVFMPDKFVFPGGRIEAGDRVMRIAGALDSICETRLTMRVTRPSPGKARALALAAIRETFEETGLMLGTNDYGAPDVADAGTSWASFGERGIFPDLEPLHFIARAITPPKRPKRFDTRFFAVDRKSIAAEVPDVVGPSSELIELTWVTLDQARKLDLPTITQVILEELAARIDAGFGHILPVPYYYERQGRFVRDVL
jgi:8-oxo-dGTP pyrophosphatase MutT (NUDIX family)